MSLRQFLQHPNGRTRTENSEGWITEGTGSSGATPALTTPPTHGYYDNRDRYFQTKTRCFTGNVQGSRSGCRGAACRTTTWIYLANFCCGRQGRLVGHRALANRRRSRGLDGKFYVGTGGGGIHGQHSSRHFTNDQVQIYLVVRTSAFWSLLYRWFFSDDAILASGFYPEAQTTIV